jgi:hypothetical protein
MNFFPHTWSFVQEMEHLPDEAVFIRQEAMGSTSSWLETLSSHCQIKGFVELWSVSALISLSGDAHCVSIGFSHTNAKFLLDQQSELQGNVPVCVLYSELIYACT